MKDKIKEIILSVNPGMDVEDEDFNIAEDMDSMDILALMEELEDAFDIEITMEEKKKILAQYNFVGGGYSFCFIGINENTGIY